MTGNGPYRVRVWDVGFFTFTDDSPSFYFMSVIEMTLVQTEDGPVYMSKRDARKYLRSRKLRTPQITDPARLLTA